MPRTHRYVVPGLPHHLIQRGNNRQPVFLTAQDARYFLSRMSEIAAREGTRVGAYCLMPNHVHLLVIPLSRDGLIATAKSLFHVFTRYFNSRHGRTGKLWENRFRLHLVDPERVWVAARYIDLNPVRAGMVTRAEDHPHSSAAAHLTKRRDPCLDWDLVGPDVEAYAQYLEEVTPERLAEEREFKRAMTHAVPAGSNRFVSELESRLETSLRIRARGRPRLVVGAESHGGPKEV